MFASQADYLKQQAGGWGGVTERETLSQTLDGGILEMTQQITVSATKPGDLSTIPGAHHLEEEDQLPHVVLCPPHSCCTSVRSPTHEQHVNIRGRE